MQRIAIIFEEKENELPHNTICYVNSKDLLFGAFESFYYPHITSLSEAISFCKVDGAQQRAWIYFRIGKKWRLMAET